VVIHPSRGRFMAAKPGHGVPAGGFHYLAARGDREFPVLAGVDPAGTGTQAEDHASRLQIGDAEVRRIAPVSATVQTGLDAQGMSSPVPGLSGTPDRYVAVPEHILL
jgi:hypothetical protein